MSLNVFGVEINVKKEILIVSAVFFTVLVGIIGYSIVKSDKDVIIEAKKDIAPETSAGNSMQEVSSVEPEVGAKSREEEIKVYVVGCVRKPGIITIKKGQLIDDAVKAAGGATQDADLNNINLVYKLTENVMLSIVSKKEAVPANSSGEAGKGIKIIKDSGSAVVIGDSEGETKNGKVNINTATLSELDTLPGVGEATAKDILSFREKNGEFKDIRDIMKVPRIKESRFNSIKDFITVD